MKTFSIHCLLLFSIVVTFFLLSCSQKNIRDKNTMHLSIGGVYVIDQKNIAFNSSQRKYGIVKILFLSQDTVCYRNFKNTFDTLPTEELSRLNFENEYVDGFGIKAIGSFSEKIDVKSFLKKFDKLIFLTQTNLSLYDHGVIKDLL